MAATKDGAMERIGKRKFIASAVWKMTDSVVSQGISLIISIVLARLLLPENYGLIAITTIFINLTTMIVQGGFSTALLRLEKVDNIDYSNVFFFSLAVAGVLYAAFFFGAPLIALYYSEPLITRVIRVQMLSLFICSLGTVRTAMATREFRFRDLCLTDLISNTISGVFSIYFAYRGYGVWALVIHTLSKDTLGCIILFFFYKWKPTLVFSWQRIKTLFSFSIWVLIGTLLDFTSNNIYAAVIGKKYSKTELGYYSKGGQFPEMLCLHTIGAITSVLLPTMTSYKSDLCSLKNVVRKIITMSAFVIFPMMVGLATTSKGIVLFLFTEKWLPCYPVMISMSIYYLVQPIRSVNMQLIYCVGSSKTTAKVELIRLFMMISALFIGIQVLHCSIYGLSVAVSLVAILVALLTQIYSVRLIGYSFSEWIKDICPAALLSCAMGAIVLLLGLLPIHPTALLLIQILIGVTFYALMARALKIPDYFTLLQIITDMLNKRKGKE